jgi:EAL domain-containing protein (putative c-di-GMP-specific phosphodiesterase class I)
LRLLSQHRFDVVKIDLSLVQGAGQDQGLSVLTSLVQMAGRLGATTIAEGVETPEQLRTIRRLGITAGQGYLLGRPGHDIRGGQVDLVAMEREALPEETGLSVAPLATGELDPRLAALAISQVAGETPPNLPIAVLNTSSVANEQR